MRMQISYFEVKSNYAYEKIILIEIKLDQHSSNLFQFVC